MLVDELLFCLLRNEFSGEPLPDEALSFRDPRLFRLAKMHDVCHLAADALIRNELLPDDDPLTGEYNRELMTAAYREIRIREITGRIRTVFQREEIPFIPLKGTVIRELYPEPWMRTSCDIDVLIHKEDLSCAVARLEDDGFTTDGEEHYHDVSLFRSGVHLELHYNILEEMEQIDGLLAKVWEYSAVAEGVEYSEEPAFYAFHHIAHMSYHFLHGGCGLRSVLDLWIMRQKNFFEERELMPLLEQCGLVRFYRCVCALADRWFDGQETADAFSEAAGKYILSGGVYGARESEQAVDIAKKKGRIPYLLGQVFLPYREMCSLYPVLKRFCLLLPFCYVHRVFKKMFGRDRKESWGKVNRTIRQDSSKIKSMDSMMKELGLK